METIKFNGGCAMNVAEFISIYIENTKGEIYLSAWARESTYYRPKFCPECGRKLI